MRHLTGSSRNGNNVWLSFARPRHCGQGTCQKQSFCRRGVVLARSSGLTY
jgi:hypothetical protein